MVENERLKAVAGGVDKFGTAAEEICKCRDIGEHESGAHAEAAERAGQFVAHLVAGKTQHKEHSERNGQNEYR